MLVRDGDPDGDGGRATSWGSGVVAMLGGSEMRRDETRRRWVRRLEGTSAPSPIETSTLSVTGESRTKTLIVLTLQLGRR